MKELEYYWISANPAFGLQIIIVLPARIFEPWDLSNLLEAGKKNA